MRSIALAMTWEYWHRNVRLIVGVITTGAALLIIPFGRELLENPILTGVRVLHVIPLLTAMIGQVVVALSTTHKDRPEFPQELYTKPVSTVTLVALRMALGISAAAGMYLGQALLIWAASGVALPLWWGPLVALAMTAAWTHALIWSLPGCILPQVIAAFLAIFLCVSYYGRHVASLVELGGDLSGPPTRMARGLYGMGMVALTGLAYAVAVVGVRFDRRGDRISLARVGAWISDRIYAIRRTDRPFGSARAAQFWCEWRQHWGLLLPLLNLLALSMYAALAMGTRKVSLEVDGPIFLQSLAFINIVFYPILVAMVVNTQERGGSKDLFWATRPASDNMLLWVRLRVAIASLLASWGVWLAGALVIWGLLWVTGQRYDVMNIVTPNLSRLRYFFFYAGLAALAMWTALGIVGSLHVTGRKLVAALWLTPIVVPVAWNILSRNYHLAAPLVAQVQAITPWAIGILCLAGTVLVYGVAVYKGRISRWLPYAAFGVYLVLVLCQVVFPYSDKSLVEGKPNPIVLSLGLAALPLVPLALGPLAIAWNRHR